MDAMKENIRKLIPPLLLGFLVNSLNSFSLLKNNFRNKVIIRKNTTDCWMFRQIFIKKEYNINYEINPKLILDLGANVGYASLFFSKKFPNSKIIAIEPEKENFKYLKKNTSSYKNITPVFGGVWNKDTYLELKRTCCGECGYLFEETNKPSLIRAYSIETILNKFAKDFKKIDILKIDIEGSEKELFSSNFNKWLKRTKILILGVHDKLKPGCQKSINKALKNYNYKLKLKGENKFYFIKNEKENNQD
jgi:FkbM family methyltransferase